METISLPELYTFLDATPTSKNINEGEAILKANHIIFCGTTKLLKTRASILAYVSQVSTTGEPFEVKVTGEFKRQSSEIQIIDMICSCEDNKSKRCKHIAAVLLYCSRMDIKNLERFSANDLKSLRPQEGKVSHLHTTTPASEWNCIKKPTRKLHSLTQEQSKSILEALIEACPESPLAQLMKRK